MRPVKLLCAAFAVFGMAACSNELKVSGVEPPQGTFAGGEDVVIQGNGFQPNRGVQVKFGMRDATSVVVASGDKIKVTTPGGDPNATVDVTVIFDDGKAFKLANGFHYMAQVDQRGTLDKAFNTLGKDAPSGTTAAPTKK